MLFPSAIIRTVCPWLLMPLLLLLTGCNDRTAEAPSTVKAVDLERYAGLWHEIARYENRFEEGCVGATADYRIEEGFVRVVNSCYDGTGRLKKQKTGKAYVVEGSGDAKLRVTFFPPFYGDYWILMLADDYRYSVVGGPQKKYLWILARGTVLSDADRGAITAKLLELGYDPFKLYWTGFKAMCTH